MPSSSSAGSPSALSLAFAGGNEWGGPPTRNSCRGAVDSAGSQEGRAVLKPWIASTLVVAGLALFLAPGALADVTEFPLPHADSRPYTIVAGPDGNLWFTES